ncbi:MAG TPA: hypothetical protein VE997_06910, partial [Candidatus Limnocylindria bacterium]|nr:hypothetical protein [Candidatus Limnocylindria bacterium]
TLVRVTDRNNGSGNESATMMDIPYPVDVGCVPTVSLDVGSTCAVDTSLNAVVPGAVRQGDRAVWQLGEVSLDDGGADGDPHTLPNGVFARQGVFVP